MLTARKTPAQVELSLEPTDDATLAARLRTGDPVAATEFYDRFAPRIFRFIRQLLGTGADADAEDLLQESFIALAETLPYFRGESSLATFAYAIAHRKVQSFIRLRARRARIMAERPIAAEAAIADGPDRDMRRAIALIAPEYREVILLKYVDEMTVAEIAAVLAMSEHAVESRLARARRALKKKLEE